MARQRVVRNVIECYTGTRYTHFSSSTGVLKSQVKLPVSTL
jgi:hypothetical protein